MTATVSVATVIERLPQIASAVLAIALAVELGYLALGLLGSSGIGSTATPSAPAEAVPARRTLDVQSIVNAHLFGIAASSLSKDASNAPNTSMNLVLAGTIATDDPKHGLAIIGETTANTKVYSVGDAVNGGVTLHAVYTDRVLLERGGAIEALTLPRQSLKGPGGKSAAFLPPPGAATGPSGSALAENVRRLIAHDPGSLTQIMRTQPVFMNGQQRGFRVYPGTNRQQFARLGLQPGDLVTSVNGTPLDDPARGSEIFRTIGSADSVRVTIERNGQRQELTLNMAQIASQAQELEAGNAAGAANQGMIPMNQVPQMPADDSD
jgi:general secretion pathway protein C